MDRTYLQWNLPNWITVVLMASLGMVAVGAVTSMLSGRSAAMANDE